MNTNFGCNVRAIKYPGSIYGRSGTSDIIACVFGQFVMIEVKRPGEDARKLQKHEGQKFVKAGGHWTCVSSLHEAQDFVMLLLQ